MSKIVKIFWLPTNRPTIKPTPRSSDLKLNKVLVDHSHHK